MGTGDDGGREIDPGSTEAARPLERPARIVGAHEHVGLPDGLLWAESADHGTDRTTGRGSRSAPDLAGHDDTADTIDGNGRGIPGALPGPLQLSARVVAADEGAPLALATLPGQEAGGVAGHAEGTVTAHCDPERLVRARRPELHRPVQRAVRSIGAHEGIRPARVRLAWQRAAGPTDHVDVAGIVDRDTLGLVRCARPELPRPAQPPVGQVGADEGVVSPAGCLAAEGAPGPAHHVDVAVIVHGHVRGAVVTIAAEAPRPAQLSVLTVGTDEGPAVDPVVILGAADQVGVAAAIDRHRPAEGLDLRVVATTPAQRPARVIRADEGVAEDLPTQVVRARDVAVAPAIHRDVGGRVIHPAPELPGPAHARARRCRLGRRTSQRDRELQQDHAHHQDGHGGRPQAVAHHVVVPPAGTR